MMTPEICPYNDCFCQPSNAISGPLDFCDRCRGPIAICSECNCANRLWAIFCRACGNPFSDKHITIDQYQNENIHQYGTRYTLTEEMRDKLNLEPLQHAVRNSIEQYEPGQEFIDVDDFINQLQENNNQQPLGNDKSLILKSNRFGKFYEKTLGINPGDTDEPKLAAINGSLVVFRHKNGDGYDDAIVIHPYSDKTPISMTGILNGDQFTGSCVCTDTHLFFPLRENLAQVSIPAASTGAFPIENHTQFYSFPSDTVYLLSSDFLLLVKKIDENKKQFRIWDIKEKKCNAQIEIISAFYQLDNQRLDDQVLLVLGPDELAIFRIELKEGKFEELAKRPLEGWMPESKPRLVGNGVYLLAKSNGNNERILVKYAMESGGHFGGKPEVVHKNDSFKDLEVIKSKYMLSTSTKVGVYETTFNSQGSNFSFGMGIYRHVDIQTNGQLIAVPVVNHNKAYSIDVVNGISGQYVFSTEAYGEIYSSILVFERFLYVIGKKYNQSDINLYGYDLI